MTAVAPWRFQSSDCRRLAGLTASNLLDAKGHASSRTTSTKADFRCYHNPPKTELDNVNSKSLARYNFAVAINGAG